jgi:threonine/homoserine/homoserine lactone efflux protein
MIDPALYLTFIAASAVLILIPGPNVALIVANSVAYGTRFGLLTIAGSATAMLAQLTLVTLGMAAVLGTLGVWMEWLRWLGVIYLVIIGVRLWRTAPLDLTRTRAEPRSGRGIYLRGLLVSLTNPKTLLFFGAFFPQFLAPDRAMRPQLLTLSVTFLAVAAVLDTGWALLAGRARGFLAARGRLRNRLSGGLLIGCGVGLALARRR